MLHARRTSPSSKSSGPLPPPAAVTRLQTAPCTRPKCTHALQVAPGQACQWAVAEGANIMSRVAESAAHALRHATTRHMPRIAAVVIGHPTISCCLILIKHAVCCTLAIASAAVTSAREGVRQACHSMPSSCLARLNSSGVCTADSNNGTTPAARYTASSSRVIASAASTELRYCSDRNTPFQGLV